MPPSLRLLAPRRCLFHTPITTVASPFLLPFLLQQSQQRSASILSSLSDNRGATHNRKRLGRGPASGRGKTAGRGQKGQKAHGKVPAGFNGGQTPDEIVHGPRGFVNRFSEEMSPINLNRIQDWIDQGRLDPSKPITMKELNKSRCLHGVKDGVKLLARGSDQLRTPINIIVSRASAAAIAAVEAVGGTVTTRFYSPGSIRRVLGGTAHPYLSLQSESIQAQIQAAKAANPAIAEPGAYVDPESIIPAEILKYPYRLADATSRKDIEYYRDPAHRGYLSYLVPKGHSPSLFFKVPGQDKGGKKGQKKSESNTKTKAEKEANKLW